MNSIDFFQTFSCLILYTIFPLLLYILISFLNKLQPIVTKLEKERILSSAVTYKNKTFERNRFLEFSVKCLNFSSLVNPINFLTSVKIYLIHLQFLIPLIKVDVLYHKETIFCCHHDHHHHQKILRKNPRLAPYLYTCHACLFTYTHRFNIKLRKLYS